jgi:DNA polymerase I-like protein with 3'-5' exonuclease and polymerase domains
MSVFAVDFETFFSAEISADTLGAWAYARHPDADPYLVAIAGTDGTRYCGDPQFAPWDEMAGHTWVSHNAGFDQLFWMRLAGRTAIPQEGPAAWWCTAAMAAFLQAPRSLAGACEQLLNVKVDKTQRDQMKGVRWSDLNAIGQQGMIEYAQADADRCLELWVKHADKWPDAERRLAQETVLMGWKGLPVDFPGAAQGVETLTARLQAAETGIPWVAAGKKPLSRKEFDLYCRTEGLPVPESMAKDDEDFAKWLDDHAENHPVVGHVREWRRINALLKKVQTLHSRTDVDHHFRYGLKYCGAQHTGRWSGDAGFNVQNLPRGEMFGVDLRTYFKAPAGYTFVITDLSQIEPRILNYLASNEAMMSALRDGWNVYEAGANSWGWAFTKGELKKENPGGYAAAKAQILGLGYGCAADTFGRVAPLLTGGSYRPTPMEASRAVSDFRAKNPGIVDLWNQLDGALKSNVGQSLSVELPSGRNIQYFNLKRGRRGIEGQTVMGYRHENLYGALLVENMVQATARELFAHGLLAALDADVDVRLHVHDEIVSLAALGEVDAVQARQEAAMTAPPYWMSDLPLACETTVSEVYCK